MAIKARQKGRSPKGRSSSFQRRLSWREVELAFDHLFDVGLDDDEAQRISVRFKRARSQILPIFAPMVVSPYERERQIALAMLARIGGQTTAKMLDGILADEEIHDAFKLDVRRLREELAPGLPEDDDEDELEDGEEREGADETAEADDEAAPSEAAETTESESREKPSRRRRRSGRGRGKREQPPAETSIDPQVFDGDPKALLPHLTGDLEPVLQAFGDVALPKRLSFVDRSGRLQDPAILTFLLPLLKTDEWALVQSALRAIGQLGFAQALPDVEELANDSSRKRVKLRAERVREQLLSATQPEAADAPAEAEPSDQTPDESAEPQPKSGRGRGRGRGKPQPKRRGQSDESEPTEPAAAQPDNEFGLATLPLPEPGRNPEPAIEPPAKLPKLGACLASGIRLDGLQRLLVYRQTEERGDDQAWDRIEIRIHGQLGWVDLDYTRGLPPTAVKDAQAEGLVEVTVGYIRGRLIEASDLTKGMGHELPEQADAALAFVGSGRRQELSAELPEQADACSQETVETLLNHPLFAGWQLPLDPTGGAVQRWEQTTGKRSASRVRRRLIDDVAKAWYEADVAPNIATQLGRQALLLQRAGEDDLAQTAAACAATLTAEQRHPERHLLLRELVYRGFQEGLDAAQAQRERRSRAAYLNRRRSALARSAFQRGLRRR